MFNEFRVKQRKTDVAAAGCRGSGCWLDTTLSKFKLSLKIFFMQQIK